jgi:Family of unknown function (DUF6502)
MENKIKQALTHAIQRVLYALVRVLIRHEVAFDEFAEMAKRAYVEVGMKELAIEGRHPSISRVSIISGLTRKEVQRIANLDVHASTEEDKRYNRASRVIAGWVRDPLFVQTDGEPRPLSLAAADESGFAALVKRHGGDVPARAMLDELLRVGTVEKTADGLLRLLSRVYIPSASEIDKLVILGTDVSDLINTIEHNLQHGATEPFFQRKVMYDNLPAQSAERFRNLSKKQAQALIEKWDQWLAEHDRDENPQATGEGRIRAGFGIYYFQERLL